MANVLRDVSTYALDFGLMQFLRVCVTGCCLKLLDGVGGAEWAILGGPFSMESSDHGVLRGVAGRDGDVSLHGCGQSNSVTP